MPATAMSGNTLLYMRHAISSSTRKGYDVAMRRYEEYRLSQGAAHEPAITATHAANWLISMADAGELSSSTIKHYRSALSTFYTQTQSFASRPEPNPLEHPGFAHLIRGIVNRSADREHAQRVAHPKSTGVTMAMIEQLASVWSGGTPMERMLLAAAALATCGCHRPSEVLGSSAHRERRLRLGQIVFYADEQSTVPISSEHATAATSMPDHCCVTLHVSKTNQQRRTQAVYIAAPTAVSALWTWMRYRHTLALADDTIFQQQHAAPLSSTTLISFVTTALSHLGHRGLHLTGKCFRIGGTSSLHEAGVGPTDLSRSARWTDGSAMHRTYTMPESAARRAIEINRGMH